MKEIYDVWGSVSPSPKPLKESDLPEGEHNVSELRPDLSIIKDTAKPPINGSPDDNTIKESKFENLSKDEKATSSF